MKYVYAALLLHSSAQPVTEENVKKVVTAAGSQVEEAQVKALVAALSEVNIDEALKSASVMAAPVAAPATPAESKKEDKKPAEEEKKKEEEALAGLGALFG
ncbi:MAG TPA: 50S ribosomal protein P1 [Candidatus Sulfotelmatobacter sp.]|jgi:large subunit ribosomal protein L12|nr:50S ribosomal protein P1 [Candidatus Sulfotelmatobacter sp.]